MIKFLLSFSIISFFLNNYTESGRPNFSVTIENYIEVPGYTYTYIINCDSLLIRFNCDWENCSDTIVYRSKIDEDECYNYFEFLKSLHLETLENFYKKSGADGLTTAISVSGESITPKTVVTIRYRQPVIKRLIDSTNRLITDNNRKIKYY